MQVKDVMTTDLDYCLPEDSWIKAARLMKENGCGIVPIIASEANKQLLGVVTDRDLCMTVIAEGLDPNAVKLKQCMRYERSDRHDASRGGDGSGGDPDAR